MVNHYETLGIPNYSSYAVVRKAYLKKIKACHPDVNPSADAAIQAARYNEAKEALETASRKEKYDSQLLFYMQYGRRRPSTVNAPRKPSKKEQAEELRRRKEAQEARVHAREMKVYEKSIQSFPLEIRYTLLALLDVLILSIPTFSPANEWFFHMIFLFSPHLILVIVATSEYYKQIDYKAFMEKKVIDKDKATKRFIWVAFLGGMFLSLLFTLLMN